MKKSLLLFICMFFFSFLLIKKKEIKTINCQLLQLGDIVERNICFKDSSLYIRDFHKIHGREFAGSGWIVNDTFFNKFKAIDYVFNSFLNNDTLNFTKIKKGIYTHKLLNGYKFPLYSIKFEYNNLFWEGEMSIYHNCVIKLNINGYKKEETLKWVTNSQIRLKKVVAR